MTEKKLYPQQKRFLNNEIERVIDIVGIYMCVPPEIILSKSREKEIVISRHIVISVIFNKYKSKMNLSLKSIGRLFSKDHTTILNSVKAVRDLIDTDSNFKTVYNSIIEEFELEVAHAS